MTMSKGYQQHVDRRLHEGNIARFSRGRGQTGYIYHRDGRYWLLVVDERGGLDKEFEKPLAAWKRRQVFDERYVEVVAEDDVPAVVAALSRSRGDE